VKSKFELVIFDCDGVLVDSERIANQVFAQMLNELGISITLDEMFERFMGHSMAQCLEFVATLLGKPPPLDLVETYVARTKIAFASQLKPIQGIESALNEIQVPYCVASSGTHEKMRVTLSITKLLPYFEGKLFSVTEVARAKPAPDLFFYAASKYNVAPAACVVIEDTPTGVSAGIAAGMTVFGYSDLMPPRRLLEAGAHRVFSTMADLPSLINRA